MLASAARSAMTAAIVTPGELACAPASPHAEPCVPGQHTDRVNGKQPPQARCILLAAQFHQPTLSCSLDAAGPLPPTTGTAMGPAAL